ncbi:signal peptidase I [Roseateles puraquae]|jgi:signal peptidase I|uniref:Signal peptidase I n=1 Tax=Roseateles puraquae TaxID=431059 RepID=A0A254N5T8_9BURK|nr:signal peptidase I [Roseateles puraquae]MDG0855349.1 signal peptidase I [Roseateles puraquae]OWR03399.1 signal peptidase I [Roseateles puraquae]
MSALTGVLYAALVAYLGGWYTGYWSGNFALLLFILTAVTMLYWLAERFHFAPARRAAADALLANDAKRREQLAAQGITQVDGNVEPARQQILQQPWWLDWTAGLFPVILVVFLLRSFLFEPFKIPSGSMVPTLLVGDLILVNKFHYGIRLPVINKKIIANHDVKRGDVMVFRYPEDPTTDFIKRVVGVPGDEVAYINQKLYINGQLAPTQPVDNFYDDSGLQRVYRPRFTEKLGEKEHQILVQPNAQHIFRPDRADGPFPFQENCRYTVEGVTCKVPAGNYFMMGDNRDNSRDSRYWGFVPDENIVGKAFLVWMNFGNLKRIGTFFD